MGGFRAARGAAGGGAAGGGSASLAAGSASRLALGSSERAITTELANATASQDSPSRRLVPPPAALVVSSSATYREPFSCRTATRTRTPAVRARLPPRSRKTLARTASPRSQSSGPCQSMGSRRASGVASATEARGACSFCGPPCAKAGWAPVESARAASAQWRARVATDRGTPLML